MKFNATLCSTDGKEPWAANVDMDFLENEIMTRLKTNYAHYRNIFNNGSVVIVYKYSGMEILIKALATINKLEGNIATVTIRPTWIRLVENGSTNDVSDTNDIINILRHRIIS